MAERFQPKEIDISSINGGEKFVEGSGINAEAINAPIEAASYAQIFATALGDSPDISEAGNVGTPQVEMIENIKGGISCKKLKFSNLKGEKGDSGIQAPVEGFYTLYVKADTGDLYVRTVQEDFNKFRLDENGNLYYTVGE